MAEERGGVMGRTHMSGTLWALETLAWDPDYFVRSVLCLGQLAARDLGGQWANRPANSLKTIFLPWHPQTCTPIERQVAAVKIMLSDIPKVGWDLLLALLPGAERSSSGTRRPAWRESIPEDWSSAVSTKDYQKQVELYAALTVAAVNGDSERLITLIRQFEHLPRASRDQMLAYLTTAFETFEPSLRTSIWDELTGLITKHRKFSKAPWAWHSEEVDKIAEAAAALTPRSPQLRYRRLFSEREINLFAHEGDYEAQHEDLERTRRNAIKEIELAGGPEAVIEFAHTVESSWRAGTAFGDIASAAADTSVLPKLLNADAGLLRFAGGFVAHRFHNLGWTWIDKLPLTSWTREHLGQLLAFLPFTQDTWTRAHLLLGADESSYWSRSSPDPHFAKEGSEVAIDNFIKYGRPTAALQCLWGLLVTKKPFSTKQAVRTLLAALDSSQSPIEVGRYEVIELITALQAAPDVAPEDLAKIEWAYLPLLAAPDDVSPKVLWRQMASHPEFFCDLIRLVYKSTHGTNGDEPKIPTSEQTVHKAYRLIHEWKLIPGLTRGGHIDGSVLIEWLEAVKKSCAASGHLEIALTMVGHVLFYAPPDPQSLWIDRTVAAILNGPDANDMRNGYCSETLNSRGAHWVDPTAKPERALASQYRCRAEELESAGFTRFAGSLREVAQAYEADADSIVRRHSSGDY